MESAHRKIELQSPADLNYLMSNATQAARTKLDLHFPPAAAPEGGVDEMRRRVEVLVDQYLTNTFSNLKPNLSINGLSGSEMEATLSHPAPEDLEPYDTRLASRLQSTAAHIEALTLELANLRREAPAKAAGAYTTRFDEERAVFEEARKRAEEGAVESARRDGGVEVERLKRQEEVERAWRGALGELGSVKEGIGGTTARLERAGRAMDVLDGRGA